MTNRCAARPERWRTTASPTRWWIHVSFFLLIAGSLGLPGLVDAQEDVQKQDPETRATEQAVERAVAYLLSKQNQDGAISEGRYPTTMTSLGILALSSVGHLPTDKTPQGEAMRKAVDYVLRDDVVEADGYFGSRDGSRMYGHAIITLALAEMLGMGADDDQDHRIRKRLEAAVERIVLAQQASGKDQESNWHYGGWRYEQTSGDADLSVTVWQVLALRAANNAGLEVPKAVIDRAILYVKRCYRSELNPDGTPKDMKSGCAYERNGGPTYTSASAGLLALQVCGEYDCPQVIGSADWLRNCPVQYSERFFFYGTYYFAQGMYQRGGDYADYARRLVERILLENQEKDGYWNAYDGQERDASNIYSTSMAVLSLSLYYHYLPIYQR
jgi:prenyltransferase beta subunit